MYVMHDYQECGSKRHVTLVCTLAHKHNPKRVLCIGAGLLCAFIYVSVHMYM